jgi:hypothetical protein
LKVAERFSYSVSKVSSNGKIQGDTTERIHKAKKFYKPEKSLRV